MCEALLSNKAELEKAATHFKTNAIPATFTGNSGSITEIFIFGEITAKELDKETGLYYYGARYLDPKTSRWLSADPAMGDGDYLPSAPVNNAARRRNQNLPGNGGVYNTINLHLYRYAGNNPIKLTDPDGRMDGPDHYVETYGIATDMGFTDEQARIMAKAGEDVDSLAGGLLGTNPVVGLDQSMHFNTKNPKMFRLFGSSSGTKDDSRYILSRDYMEKAVALAFVGDLSESLEALGIGAHPLQDMYTHTDNYVINILGIRWSHFPFGMAADDRRENAKGFDNAADAVRLYFQEYIDRTHPVLRR